MAWNCLEEKNEWSVCVCGIIVLIMIRRVSKLLQQQVYDEMHEEENHERNQLNHRSISNKNCFEKKMISEDFDTLMIDLMVILTLR